MQSKCKTRPASWLFSPSVDLVRYRCFWQDRIPASCLIVLICCVYVGAVQRLLSTCATVILFLLSHKVPCVHTVVVQVPVLEYLLV